MSLDGLVSHVEMLRSRSAETERLSERELAQQVLIEVFGVEPSFGEVSELVNAVEASRQREESDSEFWADDEFDTRERQTRGGREVVHKSEHRAG